MDYAKLAEVTAALEANIARKNELEEQWLIATAALEELG